MNRFTALKKHKVLLILSLLLIIIPLFFLSLNPQSQNNAPTDHQINDHQWQDYNKQVQEGLISPADKVLDVSLTYSEQQTDRYRVNKLTKRNGYVPKTLPDDHTHRLQLLNAQQQVLAEQFFSISLIEKTEAFNPDGSIDSYESQVSSTTTTVTVLWQPEGAIVRILDRQGQELLVKPLSNVEEINNPPDFSSINPEALIEKKNEGKDLLNFLNPAPVHAQASDGKIDFVFISSNYANAAEFQNEINRVGNGLFSIYEPFKTRASQFRFHAIHNTDPLGCVVDGASLILKCNQLAVTQRVNRAGTPADVYVIMHNDTNPNIRASAGKNYMNIHRSDRAHNTIAHEAGHIIGGLLDEYVNFKLDAPMNNTTRTLGDISARGEDPNRRYPPGDGNCYAGKPPAAPWNNQVAANDYRLGCTYQNWYASSQTSIMASSKATVSCFNTVSQVALNRRIDALAGQFPGGSVPIFPCNNSIANPSPPPPGQVVPTFQCLGGVPCNPTPTPTTAVAPTIVPTIFADPKPCVTNNSTLQSYNSAEHFNILGVSTAAHEESNSVGGFFQKLFELLFRLIELIIERFLGSSPGTGNPGTGNPGTGNPGTGSPGNGNPGGGTGPFPTTPCANPTDGNFPTQPAPTSGPTADPVPTTAITPAPTLPAVTTEPTAGIQPTTIQPSPVPDPCTATSIQTTNDSEEKGFFVRLIELLLEFLTKLIAWVTGSPAPGNPGTPTPTAVPNPTAAPAPTPCTGNGTPITVVPTTSLPTAAPPVKTYSCKLTGKLDYSQAPDTEAWLRTKGIPALQQWYPVIADAIAHPDYKPFCNVVIVMDPNYDGLAKASFTDQTITIQPKWVRDHPEDLGMLIHEGTHIIQSYGAQNRPPGWVIEGIADWTRDYIMKDRPQFYPKKTDSYTSSYRYSAFLFEHVQKKYDPNFVRKVNVAAHNGTYSDSLWTQTTGKNVDQLWAEAITTVP